jgi:hypothetical protein
MVNSLQQGGFLMTFPRMFAAAAILTFSATAVSAATLVLERVLVRPFAPVSDIVPVSGSADQVLVVNLLSGGIDIFDASTNTSRPFLGGISIEGVPLASTPFAASAYSVALSPDFATTGKFFVSLNTADKRNIVVEYTATQDNLSGTSLVDPATQRRITTISHPDGGDPFTHYGGALRFGPDGYLYLSTGDSDWPVDAPETNPAQDRSNRLGAVLRIDPTGNDFPDDPENNYAIPPGNPDFGDGSDPALYAIGVRNPYKIEFHPSSGALIIADVGELQGDEISAVMPSPIAPPNLGWPAYEGSNPFSLSITPLFGQVIDPILDILQGTGPFDGFSLTGGVFYDGPISGLTGRYIFADFGNFDPAFVSPIWSVLLDPANNTFSDLRRWDAEILGGGSLGAVVAIGQDARGSLYFSTLDLATASGEVFILRAPAPIPLPPALGLMLTGVGALLVLNRRRRS